MQENLLVYVMVSVYSALETGDLERQLIDVVLISVCSVRGARKPAGVCNGQCLLRESDLPEVSLKLEIWRGS